jgi:S-adenosylmethionine:tRNA ribosyltransferase-isomerase
MRTDELDFHLPPELIAQMPTSDRAASRLLRYRRADRSIAHRKFIELPSVLNSGDLLVFNDAKVIPARFALHKPTGGRVEALFLAQTQDGRWTVMLRNLGAVSPQMKLRFAEDASVLACVVEAQGEGVYTLRVESPEPAVALLTRLGRMPLPPYIKRDKDHDARDDFDRQRYQTVFARAAGSVAAPTAGLHFTEPLLSQLHDAGIERTFVTLHVGLGTFKPITATRLEDHVMHVEPYTIGNSAAEALNRAKKDRRRIIAVGTTSGRVLESQPEDQPFEPETSQTSMFIHPPYRWRHLAGLITNFHLPRSTLIALVAAMTGLDEQRRIYQTAIAQGYRFFSYGDAMLVE